MTAKLTAQAYGCSKKRALRTLSLLAAVAMMATAVPAVSIAEEQVQLTPAEIEWSPGPSSIPEGAQATVLYGNPGEEGVFALRLKLPDGYHIAPHFHPRPEIVTVISGTFRIGHGENADWDASEALEPGSFFAFPPEMVHFAYSEGETVIQLNSTGPWALEYVNPEDDPRS